MPIGKQYAPTVPKGSGLMLKQGIAVLKLTKIQGDDVALDRKIALDIVQIGIILSKMHAAYVYSEGILKPVNLGAATNCVFQARYWTNVAFVVATTHLAALVVSQGPWTMWGPVVTMGPRDVMATATVRKRWIVMESAVEILS